jgi:hypothetical protein
MLKVRRPRRLLLFSLFAAPIFTMAFVAARAFAHQPITPAMLICIVGINLLAAAPLEIFLFSWIRRTERL